MCRLVNRLHIQATPENRDRGNTGKTKCFYAAAEPQDSILELFDTALKHDSTTESDMYNNRHPCLFNEIGG